MYVCIYEVPSLDKEKSQPAPTFPPPNSLAPNSQVPSSGNQVPEIKVLLSQTMGCKKQNCPMKIHLVLLQIYCSIVSIMIKF